MSPGSLAEDTPDHAAYTLRWEQSCNHRARFDALHHRV